MDREKRRSEEHEAELDRRIALIREKNQQIEQRTKEIEEDRVRNEDSIAKSPKTSTQTSPHKATTSDRNGNNGQWSREWDKGKTPAETWRENVPSMDLKGRLAGQQGGNHGGTPSAGGNKRPGNNNNNNNSGRSGGNPRKEKEGKPIPSRLEGRISFPNKEGQEKERNGNGGRRGGKDGGRGQHPKREGGEQEKKKTGSTTEAVGDVQKGQRRRGEKNEKEHREQKKDQKKEKAVPAEKNKENVEKKQKKPRVRSESDNYAVKKVVHRMVDKVCWMERMEKRKAANELAEEPEPKSDNEEIEEAPEVTESAPASPEAPKSPEEVSEKTPEDAPEQPKTPEATPEPSEEPSKKQQEEDTNQNVINLVRDKVVTMTTSQIL